VSKPATGTRAGEGRAQQACEEGRAALARGNPAAAEALAKKALLHAPEHLEALLLLRQCTKMRKGSDYEALLRRILQQTSDLQATFELAEIFFARGENDECAKHLRRALALAPLHPQAHWNMGIYFTATARPDAAEIHYRRIVELAGAGPRVANNLAECLKRQGKLDESEIWFRKATELEPANADAWLAWCDLAEERGNLPRAWELLGEAERAGGTTPQTRLTRALLLRREGKFAQAVELLSQGGGTPPIPNLFERGLCYKSLDRPELAWADFAQAKKQCREVEGHRYREGEARAEAGKLRQFFVRDRMASIPRAGVRKNVPQPLFIVGFPRSGTTLVEQILSSHPMIAAGDELRFVEWVARLSPRWLGSKFAYPECLAELSIGDNLLLADRLRDYYLGCARQMGILDREARFFTDKMPLNEMHLGLIHILFPASPILYVRRHPLDIVCSNFESFHPHGFNQAFAVETIARHYVLIDELVNHYREQLDLNVLEIRYEDLVAHQEREVRRMLEFVGVEFDLRCLSFHENRRLPRTGSYAQVTEKLYGRSVYRYRRYRTHLDEAAAILHPVLARLGYSSD